MKIYSDNPAGAASIATARANEQSSIGQGSKYQSAQDGVVFGQDEAGLSGLASQISITLAADESATADKVSSLSEIYARGQYQPDAASLSRSLVSHALRFDPGGDDL